MNSLARTMFRSLMGVALAAASTWLANYLTDRIFGSEEIEAGDEGAAHQHAA